MTEENAAPQSPTTIIGSLSKEDGDSNEKVKNKH